MVSHIHHIVADDFALLNQKVVSQLHSQVPLVESIGHYLVEAGGKRMRPTLVLLCARALGYSGAHHIDLATVIEFLHTATLLHDDVVDMSEMRRGRPTANVQWGNPSSVLVGDFIYSRAFQLLVNIGDMKIMDVMATTTNRISEGEVLQLVHQHNPDTSEAAYMEVIRHKTAILFAAACQSAGILARAPERIQNALHDFGLDVGMAFQLIDDVLDYSGDSSALGKNVGDDLAEGKPTLPLIYTLEHGDPAARELIKNAIVHGGGLEHLQAIIDAVRSCGALDYTRKVAETRIAAALQTLEALPDSPYRTGLKLVADAALNRSN
ncbi:MAG: polyprenyl synthetase family protein [Pseudomonadales bacterium]|jgi:octaprenyl-diphosphate synthase|nr:polyprenyl synthetase family protein [Pseudomonadales bacterium]